MATLTQAQAQEILRQTSTVGVPTKTINSYGGLQAIRDIAGGPAYVQQRLAEEAATNALRDAYNSGSISVAQIQAMENRINSGQDTTTAINRTLSQAAAPGTYEAPGGAAQPAASAYDYIDQYLYQPFLGRTGETAGREFYGQEFGPSVDAAEAARFIRGAVDAGEITPERGNELLSQVSGYSYLEPLYQEYLGRPGDIGGLTSYAQSFGPEIDLAERQAFIEGAVGAGELSRARADELLAGLTSGADTGGATNIVTDTTGVGTTGGGLTAVDTSTDRGKIIDMYQTQLGRTPSDAEVEGWLSQIGKTLDKKGTQYTFDDLTRDFAVGAQRELGYRKRQEFVRNIPEFQPTAVPQIEFPTAPPPRPVLGLTGLAATPQNIQTLYQSYLGRPAGVQEVATQQGLMGPVISPQQASDFYAASMQELAGAGNAPRSFLGGAYPAPVEARAGGAIRYQEGGLAEPTSPKLSAADLGSRFDAESYKDEQGRLVGGYSRPVRDEYGVIVGYEPLRPYEENVVFGEELRERQAAAPLDSERAMLDMLARQGRTGINPMTGGLPGIMAREAMMRSQPQYYSTIEEGRRYRGMAKGGLADVAQELASKGRGGDTILAHINPQEARLLKALGGSGTINPETGLPEFIFGRGKLIDINIGKKSQQALAIAAGVASGLGYIPSFIPGLGPVASTAVIAGGVGALGNRSLSAGLQLGLSAYGAGKGTEAISNLLAEPGAAAASAGGGGTGAVGEAAGGGAAKSAMVDVSALPPGTEAEFLAARPEFSQATSEALGGISTPGTTLGQAVATPTQTQIAAREALAYNPLSNPEVGGIPDLSAPFEYQAISPDSAAAASQGFLERNLPASVKEYIPQPILDASGRTLLTGAGLTTAAAGMASDQARAKDMAARYAAEQEKKRRRFDPQVAYLQNIPIYGRSGGLMKLAGGGMTYMEAGGTTGPTGTPRDVTGTGDGMSDSVPATIEGVQEARLADGEFVIPADVVADIGNGSSDAGSKKLYDMMDRIRMARHGTTEQPPEIKAERLMPA